METPIDVRSCINEIAEKCDRLPEGWQIVLSFCAGEVSLSLFDPNGDEVDVYPDDCCHVRAAIETAIEESKTFVHEEDRCARCRGAGVVASWSGSVATSSVELSGVECAACGGTGRTKGGA